MTKLHFPQLDARSLNPARPAQSLRISPNTNHTPSAPLCKMQGAARGRKKERGFFP